MRKSYSEALKVFLHQQFKNTRISHHLSQAEAAEYLAMDPRSYADIDRGKTLCSTTTFALFLAFLCDNPNEFIENVRIIMKETYENDFDC